MPIEATRALLRAALSGELDGVEYRTDDRLRLRGAGGGAGRRREPARPALDLGRPEAYDRKAAASRSRDDCSSIPAKSELVRAPRRLRRGPRSDEPSAGPTAPVAERPRDAPEPPRARRGSRSTLATVVASAGGGRAGTTSAGASAPAAPGCAPRSRRHDAGMRPRSRRRRRRRDRLEDPSDAQPLRRGRGRDQRGARERLRGRPRDARLRHRQGLRLPRRPGRDRDPLRRGARRRLPARALGRRLLAHRGRRGSRSARSAPPARRAPRTRPTSPATSSSRCSTSR